MTQQATNQDEVSLGNSKQRKTLMQYNGSTDSNGAYISPSDAIMSPASQKLANFKQRQIDKQSNPTRRTLFARTVSSTSSTSSESKQDSKSSGSQI